MDSQNEPKKNKEHHGLNLFRSLFEIKRPSKNVQSATLPRTKSKSDEESVSRERLFVRHHSYRRSNKKNKYKKENPQKDSDEKFATESESNVKRICQQFELAESNEQSINAQPKQLDIIKQTSTNNDKTEEQAPPEIVIEQILAKRVEQLTLLKELHENVKVKKRIYEKKCKQSREKKIQSFVEAENDEQAEEYRKSLISEMDIELAHMKKDGFLDDDENVLLEDDEVNVSEDKNVLLEDDEVNVSEDKNVLLEEQNVLLEEENVLLDEENVLLDDISPQYDDDVFSVSSEEEDTFLELMRRNRKSNDSDTNTVIFEETPKRQELITNEKSKTEEEINSDDEEREENMTILIGRFQDEFSESLGDELENGLHIVEAYNDEGRELIEVQVVIDRRTVNLHTSQSIDETFKDSDMIFLQNEDKSFDLLQGANESEESEENAVVENEEDRTVELCSKSNVENMCELMKQGLATSSSQEPLYEYIELPNADNPLQPFYVFAPLSNRSTIYSTTSQESSNIDDDDEGIEIGRTKDGEEVYQNARRETFCDDKGIIRIERIAFSENTPFMKESVATPISRSNSTTPTKRLEFIMDEIKSTEKKYVEDLAKVIKVYKPYIESNTPENLKKYKGYLFGNIERIYRRQRKFLESIQKSSDVDDIVQCFIDNEILFELYPNYFRNKPKADSVIKEFSPIIKEMQEKFEERLDFSAYLLTPVQRLGKYILFLENIEKQLKNMEVPLSNVQAALELVRYEMSKGNDSVAIESIENSPISKMDYGSFKMREKFNISKPRKVEASMVFIFTNVVVFTTTDPRNLETFYYYDSIKMNDLRIATFEDFTIHLTDFTKSKKKQNSTRYTYILESKTEKIWKTWKEAIEKILWEQLLKAKETSLNMASQNRKRFKVNRSRIKSAGSSVFYCE